MNADVVALLLDLVRIPSVNPMGRPANGDIYYEHRMTAHLEGLFRELGLPQTDVKIALQKAVDWYLEHGYVREDKKERIKRFRERK